ncbi:addiction module toxin, HicA family [Paenibacillus melissococcoides]|uniref:Addiction module toxin, HicA family n=1 Tax=Paenibacillus melissococcoides TaxID=2912268 RepID=A0ABN8U7G1_9BACL|nr:addiction module toxin, HicA family [Paenibacillus melissococcoides]CAH8246325.1 addiction module toxin, HicA family [Paenibacillus melissococcoides]
MVNLDKAYSSREIIKILKSDGWVHKNTDKVTTGTLSIQPKREKVFCTLYPKKDLKPENDKKHLRAGGADLSLPLPRRLIIYE